MEVIFFQLEFKSYHIYCLFFWFGSLGLNWHNFYMFTLLLSVCYNNELNWMLAHYISQWHCQRLWYFRHVFADGDSEVQSPQNPLWQDQLLSCNWYVGRCIFAEMVKGKCLFEGSGSATIEYDLLSGIFQVLYFTLHHFFWCLATFQLLF